MFEARPVLALVRLDFFSLDLFMDILLLLQKPSPVNTEREEYKGFWIKPLFVVNFELNMKVRNMFLTFNLSDI